MLTYGLEDLNMIVLHLVFRSRLAVTYRLHLLLSFLYHFECWNVWI